MGARLPHSESKLRGGFTLIELSIVLVIIGLIVGGVLVGKDLITAATLRSQISQIEKYNTATRTFELKYGYLPGDIPDPAAQSFGFAGRGSFAGEGDGNGLLEGVNFDLAGWSSPANQGTGETVMFWSDLSIAHMIDGDFSAASSTVSAGLITGTDLSKWFPSAKIGRRNSIYVHSIGPNGVYGQNYFGISAISKMNDPFNGWMQSAPALTVSGVLLAVVFVVTSIPDELFSPDQLQSQFLSCERFVQGEGDVA